ncbi:MAG: hypothetical protein CL766_08195 [Chloroflexi bacterium]|nr:hypothetical protein [Chloroflexota bacterium]|tara:strand:+ start:38622 stop:40001 length:1380 start_codon:yes stop_codon:yes gene_type:complete
MDKEHKEQNNDISVTIIGGGLSGISAAINLIQKGFKITLIEKRPYLGGRTFSFTDSNTNDQVDNGQHLFMGCFKNFIKLLKSLSVYDKVYTQKSLKTEILSKGKIGILKSLPYLGKFHMLPSLLRYPHVNFKDKIRIIYGMIKADLINLNDNNAIKLDKITFRKWLENNYQNENTIKNIWNLIILPTLNDDISNVSAYMGLMVIKNSILAKPKEASLGYSKAGLSQLLDMPTQDFINQRSGKILLNQNVKSLNFNNDKLENIKLSKDIVIKSDFYIFAIPFNELTNLLTKNILIQKDLNKISNLSFSPIIAIHLWFDKIIMNQEFLALLESPIQWVFNRNKIEEKPNSQKQHLCISISGASDLINLSKNELIKLSLKEIKKYFPIADSAKLIQSIVIKHSNATIRHLPNSYESRPKNKTSIKNLYLAGDWTKTGWPSTMEGAVKSGIDSSAALIKYLNE